MFLPYVSYKTLAGLAFGIAIGCDVDFKRLRDYSCFKLVSVLVLHWRINFGIKRRDHVLEEREK